MALQMTLGGRKRGLVVKQIEVDRDLIPSTYPSEQKGLSDSKYGPTLSEFLKSGKDAVRLDVNWPSGVTYGEQEVLVNGMRSVARRYKLPVLVANRRGELYLIRTDRKAQKVENGNSL